MTQDRILDRIRKCLALADSDNANEAAAALRQAQALMKKHGLTDADVAASAATEQARPWGRAQKPPMYLGYLAHTIAKAFDCDMVAAFGNRYAAGQILFIGCGHKPELAAYTWDVLHRQLDRARKAHLKTLSKRLKRTTRTRRANLFAEAWVWTVKQQVNQFAGGPSEAEARAIDAYNARHYPGLQTESRAMATEKATRCDLRSAAAGQQAAEGVQLRKPVQQREGKYPKTPNA